MGYLFCIVKLLGYFSMMREFVFVYNNVYRIGRVVFENVGAYFLELNWVFCLGLGLCYCLGFKDKSRMFLGQNTCVKGFGVRLVCQLCIRLSHVMGIVGFHMCSVVGAYFGICMWRLWGDC